MPRRPKRFEYEWPRPALTVDLILMTRQKRPRVLLIQRRDDPYAGRWAFPGGFVNDGETLESAARRELKEETNLDVGKLVQLGAFADPGRDPRGWTITVAFLGRVSGRQESLSAGDDAAGVGWHLIDSPPPLAFDHDRILKFAIKSLRRQLTPRDRA